MVQGTPASPADPASSDPSVLTEECSILPGLTLPLPKRRSGLFLFSAFGRRLRVTKLLGRTLKVGEQDREGHAEGLGHLNNVLKTQIAFAALDRAHECPVHAA